MSWGLAVICECVCVAMVNWWTLLRPGKLFFFILKVPLLWLVCRLLISGFGTSWYSWKPCGTIAYSNCKHYGLWKNNLIISLQLQRKWNGQLFMNSTEISLLSLGYDVLNNTDFLMAWVKRILEINFTWSQARSLGNNAWRIVLLTECDDLQQSRIKAGIWILPEVTITL